jgi:hypothetical protein
MDDKPGLEPDKGRMHSKDVAPDEPAGSDAEGHGSRMISAPRAGRWGGATDEAPDAPVADEPADKDDSAPGPDGGQSWSDVNRKQAIVPIRW